MQALPGLPTAAPDSLASRPGFTSGPFGACFLERPSPFHERERGLRAAYCGLAATADELQQAALSIQNGAQQTALPELRRGGLRIFAERYTQLRRGDWQVAVICGPGLDAVLSAQTNPSDRRVVTCQHKPGDAGPALPATFPGVGFGVLVGQERALFLYPTDRSTHALAVEIDDPGFRAGLLSGLLALPKLLDTLREEATEAGLQPTEAVGPGVLPSPYEDGFVELANRSAAPIRDRVSVSAGNQSADYEVVVLPDSVALLPLPPGKTGTDVIIGSRAGSPALTFRRQAAAEALERTLDLLRGDKSQVCSTGRPCGSPGVHPDIAQLWSTLHGEVPLCVPEDFALSELNPFGLAWFPGGPPDPSGNFVEVIARRHCRTDALLFLAGPTTVDPGPVSVSAGQVLLFVADSSWYSVSPDREAPALRQLDAADAIIARSVATGGTLTLRPSPPANTHYYPDSTLVSGSSGSSSTSGTLSWRHSLEPEACVGDICERFSGAAGEGLQPYLRAFHAMSPGFASGSVGRPAPDETLTHRVQLSEILPAGARGPEGQSLPDEEFVEFEAKAGERGGLVELSIVPASAPSRRYRFVRPPLPGKFAFARNGTVCFSQVSALLTWSSLSLPNGPATYTLTDPAGGTDTIALDAATYASLDGPVRRSLTRVNETTWVRADGPGSVVAQCAATRAAPGRATSFAPFVREEPAVGQAGFTFFGTQPEIALVDLRCDGRDLPSSAAESGPVLQPNAPFVISLAEARGTGRCVLNISGTTVGYLFSGDFYNAPPSLYFESVYANPGPGEFEFVRVCSEAGFELGLRGLELIDSRTVDVVVPWQVRHGTAFGSGPASDSVRLAPGECALLLDPDTTALPPLDPRDAALWTTQTGSALGDGLGAAEALLLRERTNGFTLASFGLPDSAAPWVITVGSRQLLKRLPGTLTDRAANFVSVPFGAQP